MHLLENITSQAYGHGMIHYSSIWAPTMATSSIILGAKDCMNHSRKNSLRNLVPKRLHLVLLS